MKYGNVELGQIEALLNKMGQAANVSGEEALQLVLQDKKRIILGDVIATLFDRHGRRIPPQELKAKVCNPNRNFRLNQPELTEEVHYANRIMRLHGQLGIDTGITAEQLKQETERLLALIRGNSQIANIANGIWLPVILPKLTTKNLGATLETYLKAVGRSYARTFGFGDRKFCNLRKGTLAGEVKIIAGSRHDQLIERMRQGPVIGIHFPNPLQGYSINASREQMTTLPEGFILSGLDTIIDMIMSPDILARDHNTPGLDLAALSWQSPDYSLSFRALAGGLGFDLTAFLVSARDDYSSGLLFLG